MPTILFMITSFITNWGLSEIPDDWWAVAGMEGFMPSAPTYTADDAASLAISLRDIAPPYRNLTTPKDFRGFDRVRMVSVLTAIANGTPLPPPVELIVIPKIDAVYKPHDFGLLDGTHRFFGSIAVGFDAIPSTTREPFQ
ncbi:hypothetical protein AB9F47_20815 [Rhizobium leguminosarum]|uniref:hypothetical protein n=1 Tax=Rhizobium leguminosarum TaxID=384 RepID=UPI003F9D94C5